MIKLAQKLHSLKVGDRVMVHETAGGLDTGSAGIVERVGWIFLSIRESDRLRRFWRYNGFLVGDQHALPKTFIKPTDGDL